MSSLLTEEPSESTIEAPCDSGGKFRRHKDKQIQENNKRLTLAKKQAELKDPKWHEEMSAKEIYRTSVETSSFNCCY